MRTCKKTLLWIWAFVILCGCLNQKAAMKIKKDVSMYRFPSHNAEVIRQIKRQEPVDLILRYGSWCLIQVQQEIGYIDCEALPLKRLEGKLSNKTVILDAGHGGSEAGAQYFGTMEKDINQVYTTKVAQVLEKQGINVILTRKQDQTTHLYTRSSIANLVALLSLYLQNPESKSKQELESYMDELQNIILQDPKFTPPLYQKNIESNAINARLQRLLDLTSQVQDIPFVSIHSNSTPSTAKKRTGLELILTDETISEFYPGYGTTYDMDQRKRLRDALLEAIKKETEIPLRSPYSGNYAILRETSIPAILIEIGYLNHEEEHQNLIDPRYQTKLTKAIGQGIEQWLAES